MKKKTSEDTPKKSWHRKPSFGSLYTMKGSRFIYISMNYFRQRIRFPTDREDTPQNWDELCDFMAQVGQKIKNRTFSFAKAFYWLDQKTKEHFTRLEGNDYKPEPEHVLFGDYAREWMERKIPVFASVTKKRDYIDVLNSRILPYFGKMSFASITASVIESFIDNLKRSNGSKKALSIKRMKNIVGPMSKIWNSACNDNNWTLRDPFSDISSKYTEIADKGLEEKDNLTAMMEDDDEDAVSTRNVFLLSEWQRLLQAVDPHYHPVLELLLMGMIGSELEGLLKRHVKESELRVRCKIVRDRMGKRHLKFKLKNWNRTREIPLTGRLKLLLAQAAAASTSTRILSFENGIKLPAHYFLLNMKDGSPFNYNSFRKTVWDKAIKKIGLDDRVPYAARHTFVQWSLLIGVTKTRLVDLMGHSTKKMVDEVYGKYRQGLVEERGKILDYLGEDFLALEELKIYFPERYRERMAVVAPAPETTKAPDPASTFCQSFGQSQGLYADNYL